MVYYCLLVKTLIKFKTMNLNYLETVILPQRAKEISEGKNLATRQPIYVVLDLIEQYCSGHNDYSLSTNHCGKESESGYFDESLDGEDREFSKTDDDMDNPIEVTRFYTDRIVSFFLTSEAAHEYLEYQKHNLTNSYVYVFYSGYANKQMDLLLNNE